MAPRKPLNPPLYSFDEITDIRENSRTHADISWIVNKAERVKGFTLADRVAILVYIFGLTPSNAEIEVLGYWYCKGDRSVGAKNFDAKTGNMIGKPKGTKRPHLLTKCSY